MSGMTHGALAATHPGEWHQPHARARHARARPRVAFQGEHGAYSEDAIAARWGDGAESVPTRTCAAVVAAVETGAADYGVLAVENTLAGSVAAAYDALAASVALVVVGEVVVPIRHCVLGLPGATLATIAALESHPVALMQIARFLAAHPHVEARPANDTAGAARAVAAAGDVRRAALAGRAAARRFGLAVLADGVEDRADNQTRFFVIAPDDARTTMVAAGAPARTALVATTANEPGALLRLLAPFATAALNLSKLESRPTGAPWSYQFFVEVEHAGADVRVTTALADARTAAHAIRVLGTFVRAGASVESGGAA